MKGAALWFSSAENSNRGNESWINTSMTKTSYLQPAERSIRTQSLMSRFPVTVLFWCLWMRICTGSCLTSSSEQQVHGRDGDGCGGVGEHGIIESAGPDSVAQRPLGLPQDPHHGLPLPLVSSLWSGWCCGLQLRSLWFSLWFGLQQLLHRWQISLNPPQSELQLSQLRREGLQQGLCLLAAKAKLF